MVQKRCGMVVFVVVVGVLALGVAPCLAGPVPTPGPAPAEARVEGHARIEGDVTVRVLRTVSSNPDQPPGTVYFRTYRFVPQCVSGGCRTVLYRPRGDDFTRFVLRPRRSTSGERLYRGTARPMADCETPDGVIADAFTSIERIVVHTPRIDADNVATKVKGELVVDATPTPAGAAAGCEPSHFESTFRSVGPFSSATAAAGG